jgi:hypothetical protein
MKVDDMEKRLRDAKFRHMTEDELNYYRDQKLDLISQAWADAHLQMCLICEQRLELLEEENSILNNREVTADDVALVRRVLQQAGQKEQSPDSYTKVDPLKNRFPDYLRQLVDSWHSFFVQEQAVHAKGGNSEAIWHGQSEDGFMKAHATLEKDASLTIHFSSDDLSLKGMRFNVSLGSMSREISLQPVSNSEVYAKVKIARGQLPINLADIKIKPIL